MANYFKRKLSNNVGTSLITVGDYTVPSGNQTTIIGLTISNRIASQILVDCALVDVSNNIFYLVKDTPIPSGGALVVIGGDQKVVMEVGDTIKVKSDTANSADVIMSTLEIG